MRATETYLCPTKLTMGAKVWKGTMLGSLSMTKLRGGNKGMEGA